MFHRQVGQGDYHGSSVGIFYRFVFYRNLNPLGIKNRFQVFIQTYCRELEDFGANGEIKMYYSIFKILKVCRACSH
jgi:hypothetical protein